MGSLLKAALLIGAIAAFVFLLPFGGRTLADRWRAAGGTGDFASRLWAEMKGEPPPARGPSARRPGARAQADGRPQGRGEGRTEGRPDEGRPGAPVERHTDADRAELDRLLGEHLADGPGR